MSNTPQQIIDTGAAANDGTGESLRQSFTEVNNNFANVWAAGPVDTQVAISNNRITTTEINLDLRLAGNGIGNVAVASTIVPTIDSVYDLGSADRYFDSTHSRYYYGNGSFLTGIVTGNTTAIANGTSNVTIPVANGNIIFGVSGLGNIVTVSTYGIDINSGTISTSNVTGALNVVGGVGVAGNLYADAMYANNAEVLTVNSVINGGTY